MKPVLGPAITYDAFTSSIIETEVIKDIFESDLVPESARIHVFEKLVDETSERTKDTFLTSFNYGKEDSVEISHSHG